VGGGFGGTFTSSVCRMKKMEIGPFSWSEPIVLLSGAAQGGLASEDYAGNIGNHILERFRCTFDYEHRVVYLEPGRRCQERDLFSRAGCQWARFGDRVVAMQVLADSPAAKAGLRVDDETTAIDGKPISAYAAEDLRRMFEEGPAGEKHVIEVVREGKTKRLKLVLADIL
jgi:predicted metalloprotease with PDZ domain